MELKRIVYFFLVTIVFWSCKKDDAGPAVIEVPDQTLTDTEAEDDAEIRAFLQTHFYNYEDFQEPIDPNFNLKITIDTLAGDNVGKTPLSEQMETETISVLIDEEEGEVLHKLYYLVVREGITESPTIGDNAIVRYEGTFLNGEGFDASTTATVFNLSQVVRGYGNGITKLKGGNGPIENGDGTVSYEGHGIGLIVMPSGLGYFGSPPQGSGIPSYSPLVFKVDLLSFEQDTDLDGDGIPSIMEDVNMDGNLNNDNTDLASEQFFFPNYNDPDDDGDGIPTIEEIDLDPEGNFVGFRDSDGDGIDDHLDNDN